MAVDTDKSVMITTKTGIHTEAGATTTYPDVIYMAE